MRPAARPGSMVPLRSGRPFVMPGPMTEQSDFPRLILASASPRRRILLERTGLIFNVIASTVDENGDPGGDPARFVQSLAAAKAGEIARSHPDAWVIGADTVVVIDGRILGKPADEADARAMLQILSGRAHEVHTGFCVARRAKGDEFTRSVCTRVRFRDLSESEIDWYVGTKEPFDKAGAYGIQGQGAFLVKGIEGSYTNVVGLPVCELVDLLLEKKIGVFSRDGFNIL